MNSMNIIGSGCVAVQMPLEENLLVQRELGFQETDLLFVSGWAHIGTDELAEDYGGVCRRIERALSRADIRIGSVNVKYSRALEDVGEAALKRRHEADVMIDFMLEFGVKRASIQPTLSMDRQILAAGHKRAVREVMFLKERYAEKGLLLSLEPHIMSSFCRNAVLKELRSDYPDFPITFDPSHLLCEGERMEDILWLASNTSMVHLRDAAQGALFLSYGQGRLDVPDCVRRLAESGYDGPIALECIFDQRPNEAECEELLALKRALEAEAWKYRVGATV